MTGNYVKSIEFGNVNFQNHKENAEIYYYVGNSQIRNGQQQPGLQNIEKAYQLNPELRNLKLN